MKVSGLYLILMDLKRIFMDSSGLYLMATSPRVLDGDKHQLEMPEKTDVCAHKCLASTISNTSFVENLVIKLSSSGS
jgi:hypothetical protein